MGSELYNGDSRNYDSRIYKTFRQTIRLPERYHDLITLFGLNILIYILRACERIEQQIAQAAEDEPVRGHVTCHVGYAALQEGQDTSAADQRHEDTRGRRRRSEEHTSELQSQR